MAIICNLTGEVISRIFIGCVSLAHPIKFGLPVRSFCCLLQDTYVTNPKFNLVADYTQAIQHIYNVVKFRWKASSTVRFTSIWKTR